MGTCNSRVTKPSYKTQLRIMMSQTELLTLKLYFFKFFELVTRFEKNFHILLELVTQDFKENKLSELLTQKIKKN